MYLGLHLAKIIRFCGLLIVCSAGIAPIKAQSRQDAAPVYALIKRVLPQHAQKFQVAYIPQQNGKDVFEVESNHNKILLRGSNGVSITSALNYYLKTYGHCNISWNGTNLKLPATLPVVPHKIRRTTPYNYRYYLNYCTFNYSMSWWDWDRWQKEIDWMALNGINMPLAVTGQNSIWQRVYKNLGFTNQDLDSFFSGPAYFNWFWMGNLDGWGGPLPQSFFTQHEALQKKILARERSLGMQSVLPAFTGHVPPAFAKRFPEAKLKKTHWQGFPDVYILDPSDPMFTTIGQKFIEEEVKTYGTDHLYSADTFNENTPPTNDSLFLSNVSKKVYQSMAAADAKAKWVMQGWLFLYEAKFWQPRQIKALLNAVPDDRMIILDLFSENKPVWNRTESYYGKTWIWCMLHNFGGNVSMYGRMNTVAHTPAETLKNPLAKNLSGIGLTPEAIEQNPVMYELLLDNVWRSTPIDLPTWLNDYATRRYGKPNKMAWHAWKTLSQTVYEGAIASGGPESIITGRPTFKPTTLWTNTKKAYRPKDLLPAWDDLIKAAPDLKNSTGFQYDLIDVTRQVMANYADTLQQNFAAAYAKGDYKAFNASAAQFLTVIDDMNTLLSSHPDFLLGKWLSDARKMGNTADEKNLYEKNARNLITLWGDKNSPLHDYACKQWAGMLSSFYKPRWQQFFTYVNQQIKKQQPVDEKVFGEQLKDWEWNWVNSHDQFSIQTQGDPVLLATNMYNKYRNTIENLP
ncbi:alpha-N-acetylglucosaminidase [Mucilaginibacter sp. CSA2-8R]|uniref:alpha-N-acetylglucosaminidase n=1 Tax=Mucilaginibacter sp. CSA2-8R TaxID=3141542 RepID=UPI00315D50EF